jgi:hypothetical protein
LKERVAVLLGTVQFRLNVKVMLPENATLEDAEKAAWATIGNDPFRSWTLLDDLGLGPSMPSQSMTFLKWAYGVSRRPSPMASNGRSSGRRRTEPARPGHMLSAGSQKERPAPLGEGCTRP